MAPTTPIPSTPFPLQTARTPMIPIYGCSIRSAERPSLGSARIVPDSPCRRRFCGMRRIGVGARRSNRGVSLSCCLAKSRYCPTYRSDSEAWPAAQRLSAGRSRNGPCGTQQTPWRHSGGRSRGMISTSPDIGLVESNPCALRASPFSGIAERADRDQIVIVRVERDTLGGVSSATRALSPTDKFLDYFTRCRLSVDVSLPTFCPQCTEGYR
jgi:hypothetical protein